MIFNTSIQLLFASLCFLGLPSSQSRVLSSRQLNGSYLGGNGRILYPFSTINNILSEVTLVLPDSTASSNGLDIYITGLVCYELNVDDVQVTQSSLSNSSDRLYIRAVGVTITCHFLWEYEWTVLSVFNGRGSGEVVLDPSSSASLSLDITSGSVFPRDVRMNDCNVEVLVGDVELDGDGLGVTASTINVFETLVRTVVRKEVNTAVCSQVEELGVGALLLVVKSNDEYNIKIDTNFAGSATSGAGWMFLFLVIFVGYSIGCCVCGIICFRRINSPKSLKASNDDVKGFKGERFPAVESSSLDEHEIEATIQRPYPDDNEMNVDQNNNQGDGIH
eukprot:CCRYP_003170-RA/>CCRYP_003170-RA protein AED:0.03 eAED:0.03 QI:382/1/1/1/1/1/2/159/333